MQRAQQRVVATFFQIFFTILFLCFLCCCSSLCGMQQQYQFYMQQYQPLVGYPCGDYKNHPKYKEYQKIYTPEAATKQAFALLYGYGRLISQNKPYFVDAIAFKNKLAFFFEQGADVNARDSVGWTLVLYAAQYNCIPALEVLINFRADLSLCDRDGWNALHIAVFNEHYKALGLLLHSKNYFGMHKNEALQFKNKEGDSPLKIACDLGFYETALRFFNYYQ